MKLNSNAYLEEMKVITVKMSLNNVFNASIDNISDNLILWSENVKQILLTGMDCCPICYYYIQQTDKSLPKSTCRTCKKKFHSLCMKEWFKSAEKKTCPICRSEWH